MTIKNKKSPFKYYVFGITIAAKVFFAAIVGYKIDRFLNNETHVATLSLSVLVIFYVLYNLVQGVKNEN